MLRIKGSFLGGDAIDGAAAYKLSEHVGDDIIKYSFANDGYIDNEGQVVSKDEKHHTDIIPIASLVNNNGYCVGVFDVYYAEYPKVVFFSGNTIDTFIRGFSISEISHKEKLTAEEVKYLASLVPGATHVAFNSDYEAGGIDSDYVYVLDDKSYSEIDTKQIIQGFDNVGTIIGNIISIPSASRTDMYLGQDYNIQPITRYRVDEKQYLFKVSIPLKVETNEGIITQTVEGYLYVNEPTLDYPLRAIGFEYGMITEDGSAERKKTILLDTNYGYVTLAKLDEKYLYGSVSINSDDGRFSIYHAKEEYKHTDFIPLDALTDGLKVNVDGVEKSYCVGKLYNNNGELNSSFNPIAFFPKMDSDYGGYFPSGFPDKYLTADEVRAMARELSNDVFGEAKYVMFSAIDNGTNENEKALVSVGGILFTLIKYERLIDNKTHYLAVKALTSGEEELQLDSDYSDDVEYFYTYPSCKVDIMNERNGFDFNVTYQVYEKGNTLDKTINVPYGYSLADYIVTGSEIVVDRYIEDPYIVPAYGDEFVAEHRYDGNKTYITVPNYKYCTLAV